MSFSESIFLSTATTITEFMALVGLVISLAVYLVVRKCRAENPPPSCYHDYMPGQEAAERDCLRCDWEFSCKGRVKK